jgi:hypothetical protein
MHSLPEMYEGLPDKGTEVLKTAKRKAKKFA